MHLRALGDEAPIVPTYAAVHRRLNVALRAWLTPSSPRGRPPRYDLETLRCQLLALMTWDGRTCRSIMDLDRDGILWRIDLIIREHTGWGGAREGAGRWPEAFDAPISKSPSDPARASTVITEAEARRLGLESRL
jgi:hypothetical protein